MMHFSELLPLSLRESLARIKPSCELPLFLDQVAETLVQSFNADASAVVFTADGKSLKAFAGADESNRVEIATMNAEKVRGVTHPCEMAALGLKSAGYYIPADAAFITRAENVPLFHCGLFIEQPTSHLELFSDSCLLPLTFSQLLLWGIEQDSAIPIGAFAHDLKHYLLLCESACERMSDTTPDSEPLQAMRASLQRMQLLTSTILFYERARTKRLVPHPIRVRIADAVRDVVNAFLPIAARSDHSIRFVPSDPDLEAEIDPALFPSIPANLIDNALKYSPRGSAVDINLKDIQSHFILSICDTGPGISPSQAEGIFELGQRGDGSTHASGHGFGLAIVKRIAELHNGSAEVHATPGGGATFSVKIPKRSKIAPHHP